MLTVWIGFPFEHFGGPSRAMTGHHFQMFRWREESKGYLQLAKRKGSGVAYELYIDLLLSMLDLSILWMGNGET